MYKYNFSARTVNFVVFNNDVFIMTKTKMKINIFYIIFLKYEYLCISPYLLVPPLPFHQR